MLLITSNIEEKRRNRKMIYMRKCDSCNRAAGEASMRYQKLYYATILCNYTVHIPVI